MVEARKARAVADARVFPGLRQTRRAARRWVLRSALGRAVHIGDNSKLLLESPEPRRALRSTGRLGAEAAPRPLPLNTA
jgi:hypothetical protein